MTLVLEQIFGVTFSVKNNLMVVCAVKRRSRTRAPALRDLSLTAGARVRDHVNLCGIFGGQNGFFSSSYVFPF